MATLPKINGLHFLHVREKSCENFILSEKNVLGSLSRIIHEHAKDERDEEKNLTRFSIDRLKALDPNNLDYESHYECDKNRIVRECAA